MDTTTPVAPRMRDRVALSVWATLDELAVVRSSLTTCLTGRYARSRRTAGRVSGAGALSRLWPLVR
jgi:hypothetical protein